MSTTHFSNLTEDCAQLIFDRIPSNHLLLHVRRVSRAWQGHQQLNCRARKSLIILHGEKALNGLIKQVYNKPFVEHNIDHSGNSRNHKSFIEHNRITIWTFEQTMENPNVQFLVETFPYLHTLIGFTDRIVSEYVQSLTQLIHRFSAQLVTLQLYFDTDDSQLETSLNMDNLMNQLNSLSSLQHLTFYAYDSYEMYHFDINPQIEEPKFLTKVKEFYFDFYGMEKVMLDWIQKYEQDGRLDQLERFYVNTCSISLNMSSINQLHRVPLVNLYSFSPYHRVHKYDNNQENLNRIVSTFPSLITLMQVISERNINSLTKLTTLISPLTKLVHLDLQIQNLSSNEPLYPNSTPQLPSLKALDLTFDDPNLLPTFYQTQVHTIVHCFPNLQSIRITTEDFAVFENEIDISELEICQFFDKLKEAYRRPSLRTKYYNPYLLFDTFN